MTNIVLRLNAITCIMFGALFLLIPSKVSSFLGHFPKQLLLGLGIGLIVHTGHLLFASFKKKLSKSEVFYFSAGDQIWMLTSTLILLATDWVATGPATTSVICVAIMVSLIGIIQLWTYAEENQFGVPYATLNMTSDPDDLMPQKYNRLTSIGVSWLGIKRWVKVWLFFLNGVFLATFIFWPTPFSVTVFAAYLVSLPLLVSIMIVERGLTRFLGAGHLLPWIPLLGYIGLKLTGDAAGPQLSYSGDPSLFKYAIILLICLSICLGFDIYDLFKWLKGNRSRLGSKSEILSTRQKGAQL